MGTHRHVTLGGDPRHLGRVMRALRGELRMRADHQRLERFGIGWEFIDVHHADRFTQSPRAKKLTAITIESSLISRRRRRLAHVERLHAVSIEPFDQH